MLCGIYFLLISPSLSLTLYLYQTKCSPGSLTSNPTLCHVVSFSFNIILPHWLSPTYLLGLRLPWSLNMVRLFYDYPFSSSPITLIYIIVITACIPSLLGMEAPWWLWGQGRNLSFCLLSYVHDSIMFVEWKDAFNFLYPLRSILPSFPLSLFPLSFSHFLPWAYRYYKPTTCQVPS